MGLGARLRQKLIEFESRRHKDGPNLCKQRREGSGEAGGPEGGKEGERLSDRDGGDVVKIWPNMSEELRKRVTEEGKSDT